MAALKTVDNWGTVSKSYQRDLVEHSKFSDVMRRCPDSFAFSNGIRSNDRLSTLRKISPTLSHTYAKKALQEKYFGRSNPAVPVFGFVGRICEQKGVELLAYVAQDIIFRTGGKVQFVIGGYAPANDPYATHCASVLARLHAEHPSSLWADPAHFFLDGGLVNLGADFAVMPSLFEPGGIVQHEFFVAGTPVIAFKTGGLKDTVVEYNRATKEGNGFTFEGYRHEDLCAAVLRALELYNSDGGSDYQQLRENARRSTLDMDVVAAMWTNEFCRMCGALPPPQPQLQSL